MTTLALCVVHGQKDSLTDWSASTRWAQNVSSQDKSNKLYSNNHHVMIVVGLLANCLFGIGIRTLTAFLIIPVVQTFENNMGSEEKYMNDAIMADWIRWLEDRC
jgi:hypothetical protein